MCASSNKVIYLKLDSKLLKKTLIDNLHDKGFQKFVKGIFKEICYAKFKSVLFYKLCLNSHFI